MRYGIIGTGMMGQEHIRNIALLKGTAVTALADTDPGMLAAAGALVPDAKAFDDYRELIAADICDAYVVATPNFHHVTVMKDLTRQTKPVLCEKPLCTTVEDCLAISAQAKATGTPVWVAMEYRFMPATAALIDAVRGGSAGEPHMVSIREHRFPFLEKVGDWNRFADQTGGTLVEKCCHFFDLMRHLTGSEAVRVYASGAMDVNFLNESYDGKRPDIIDNAYVIVDFANGRRGMLDLCMFAEGSRWQETVTVTGDQGQVEARLPGPARFAPPGASHVSQVAISPRNGERSMEDIALDEALQDAGDHHGSTFYQHQRFLEFATEGGEADVTLDDGLRAVQIGWAAEQSAKSGQAVTL